MPPQWGYPKTGRTSRNYSCTDIVCPSKPIPVKLRNTKHPLKVAEELYLPEDNRIWSTVTTKWQKFSHMTFEALKWTWAFSQHSTGQWSQWWNVVIAYRYLLPATTIQQTPSLDQFPKVSQCPMAAPESRQRRTAPTHPTSSLKPLNSTRRNKWMADRHSIIHPKRSQGYATCSSTMPMTETLPENPK